MYNKQKKKSQIWCVDVCTVHIIYTEKDNGKNKNVKMKEKTKKINK